MAVEDWMRIISFLFCDLQEKPKVYAVYVITMFIFATWKIITKTSHQANDQNKNEQTSKYVGSFDVSG